MSHQFNATITIQVAGEFELQGDGASVFVHPKVQMTSAFMVSQPQDLASLDDKTKATVYELLKYNAIHRALMESRIPGVTHDDEPKVKTFITPQLPECPGCKGPGETPSIPGNFLGFCRKCRDEGKPNAT